MKKNVINEVKGIAKSQEESITPEERFEYGYSVGKVGAWDWDLIGDKLHWSKETFIIMGYEPFSICPNYEIFLNRIHPDDRQFLSPGLDIDWNESETYSLDFRIVIDDEIKILKTIHKIKLDNLGNLIRFSGIIQDITNDKINRNDLIEAKERAQEANTIKTKFLNNISHEVRTPMNGIIGFADMLNTPYLSDEKKQRYIDIIKNSADQLLKTIDDIIEMANMETKVKSINENSFSINELFNEIYSLNSLDAIEKNIKLILEKELSDSESFILSDRVKLYSIISNFTENALKFTESGSINLGYKLDGENIIFFVKDTGVGISYYKQKSIFKKFIKENDDASKEHRGIGLGLSIVKENAELIGGNITFESKKGEGSTFYLTMPYKPVTL